VTDRNIITVSFSGGWSHDTFSSSIGELSLHFIERTIRAEDGTRAGTAINRVVDSLLDTRPSADAADWRTDAIEYCFIATVQRYVRHNKTGLTGLYD